MVKLTADLIAKQAPGHNKRRADESVEHYLSRLTHLPCQNRTIDSIVSVLPSLVLTGEKHVSSRFLGCYSTLSSAHGHLSLRQSYQSNREHQFRRESNSSLSPEQSFTETGESRCLSSATEAISRWKSNSSLGRSRSMSSIERSLH